MKLVTSAEMTSIDRAAQEDYAIPGLLLMENAGQKALAAWHSRTAARSANGGRNGERRLVFVAGKGNNGGDALVMARQAAIERLGHVTVVPVDGELRSHAALHLDVVRRLGIEVLPWDVQREPAEAAVARADTVFDGVAGTGISGGLRRPLSDIVNVINASDAETVAVDVPSGLSDDFTAGSPVIRADLTLTMGLPKRCLYLPDARAACGDILRIHLGFPPALTEADTLQGELLTTADLTRLAQPLAATAYKHSRGVCAVFAGARGTTGAAVLAAGAAARSGAGMVRIFADADTYEVLAAQCRSVMVAERGTALPDLSPHNALLVGPGWGRGDLRRSDLRSLLASGIPGVLDADGINILAGLRAAGDEPGSYAAAPADLGGRWVLTPHAGELARLAGLSAREVLADGFGVTGRVARELDAVVVLKSHVTIIAAPDGRFGVVDGMNPALGTGGSGDVLAGVIAGFLAGGSEPYEAAAAGCVAHAEVGHRTGAARGLFLAEDLLERVSEVCAYRTGDAGP